MLQSSILRALAILVLLLGTFAAHAEGQAGVFGFGVSIDGEGFFLNPTLKTVTIKNLPPGLPAALAGIAAGDQLVEVEGRAVAGEKAKELEPLLKKDAGQTLTLRLKRQSGEFYSVTMVAVPKK